MPDTIYDHYTVVGPNGEPSGHIPKRGHEPAESSMNKKLQKIIRSHMKHRVMKTKMTKPNRTRKLKNSNYYG